MRTSSGIVSAGSVDRVAEVARGVIRAKGFDLNGGWGTVINDPQGDDNSTTDKRGVYRVGLSWEIPLSASKNPFD